VGHRGYFSARKLGNILINGKGLEVNVEKKEPQTKSRAVQSFFRLSPGLLFINKNWAFVKHFELCCLKAVKIIISYFYCDYERENRGLVI